MKHTIYTLNDSFNIDDIIIYNILFPLATYIFDIMLIAGENNRFMNVVFSL